MEVVLENIPLYGATAKRYIRSLRRTEDEKKNLATDQLDILNLMSMNIHLIQGHSRSTTQMRGRVAVDTRLTRVAIEETAANTRVMTDSIARLLEKMGVNDH